MEDKIKKHVENVVGYEVESYSIEGIYQDGEKLGVSISVVPKRYLDNINVDFIITKSECLIPKDQWNVHKNHCCKEHGCKYHDKDCPVVLGLIKQEGPCIECDDWAKTAEDWFETKQISSIVHGKGKKLIIMHQCGDDKESLINQLKLMITNIETNGEGFAR